MILDLNMPVLGGIETLKIMQEDTRLKSIPVIVLASSIDEALMKKCKAAGAYSVLLKPFRKPSVLHLLNKVVWHLFATRVLRVRVDK